MGAQTTAYYSGNTSSTYDITETIEADVISRSGLIRVDIGTSVTSIGDGALWYCSNLSMVTIPNTVKSIGNSSFFGDTALSILTIPASVTSIGDYSFQNCSSLTSIAIPNGVTSIGNSTFDGCTSLKTVSIPNSVTSIGIAAFGHCSNLSVVSIPNGVSYIGWAAFVDCAKISSLVIPFGVTYIGDYTLSGCAELTSLSIKGDIEYIGHGTFAGCTNLSSIDCDRMTAPTLGNNIFGVDATTYTGRNTYDTGNNTLFVYDGATGYDTGEWLDPLLNADKCGFNLQRKPAELSVITGLAGDPFTTEIVFPVSPGQEFKGWNTPIPETFTPYDMKFYPIIENYSSITFNANSGHFPNDKSILVYVGEIGSDVDYAPNNSGRRDTGTGSPPTPDRDGYSFTGWSADPLPEVFPENNMEIESIWSPLTNQITFNYNGGKIGDTTSSISTLTYDSSWPAAPNITTPKNCTVSFVTVDSGETASQTSSFNLAFNGYWSATASDGTKYYTDTRTPIQAKFTGDSDILAYAGWSGVRAPSSGNFSYSPTRNGYTFDGWYENQSRTGSKITYYSSLSANKTLYAKWTEITSESVTILNVSKSATENNKTSGGKTYTYTLTIPSSQFSSVLSTLHLKSIEVYLYAYTNNSKSTSLSVSLGSTTVSISPAAKAGSSASATKTISGNFTSYKYNTNIPLTIKFYLAKGNDHHKGNFTVKVNKVTFGK